MRYSHRKGFINQQSYVAQYFALVFLTIGVASTIGTDDLLASFAAGSHVSVSPRLVRSSDYFFNQEPPFHGMGTSTTKSRTTPFLQ